MKKTVEKLKLVLHSKSETIPGSQVFFGDPCSTEKLDALEAKIQWKLPQDYREFLKSVDGIKLDDGTESILMDLFPVSRLPLPPDENQEETLSQDGISLDNILIVGCVPMHNLYVFLDKETSETAKWMDFEMSRYEDFTMYLQSEIESLESSE